MPYQPHKINAPITLIRAQEGSQRITSDDYLAWRQVTGLNMTLHWLPGQHENMMEQPFVEKIAHLIEDVLNIKGSKADCKILI
jgi:surfactin synthase thioesterase subunit